MKKTNRTNLIIIKTFIVLAAIFALNGCKQSSQRIQVSLLNIPNDTVNHTYQIYNIDVQSNVSWTAESTNEWIEIETKYDNNQYTGSINLEIKENTHPTSRQGSLILRDNDQKIVTSLLITQQGWSIENHKYALPIVFHVLQSPNDAIEKPSLESSIDRLIYLCNKYYNGSYEHNVKSNIEFVLARHTPDNQPMQMPGINIINTNEPKRDALAFYNSKNPADVAMQWDMDKYINIFLYDFVGASGTMGGISVFPYSVGDNYLDGLKNLASTPTVADINYMHCVMLNKRYLNVIGKDKATNNFMVNDIATILSHELGHYLGLFHIFSESGANSLCGDSDYCTDTPCYDRDKYSKNIKEYEANFKENLDLLLKREECGYGDEVQPDNLMDYDYSWNDCLTPQQIQRIRFVVERSPLMPGPKHNASGIIHQNKQSSIVLEPQFAID